MLLHIVILTLFKSEVIAENIKLTTPLGDVIGTTLTSRLGKTIYAFRGIRYAQPPVEDLRFKDPVPVEKWDGVVDAITDGPACPQITQDPTSEDCLMLNVYSTELSDESHNPKKSVVVFIHPGLYQMGSGRSTSYGPEYLADVDLVVVTFNYRLGALGFLSVGKESPGNYGLKDQVMALKWVKNNIGAFGGDPGSVLLYGSTIGATSCLLHLVSPMSKGLFHKVLAVSGFGVEHTTLKNNELDVAKKVAQLVGCGTETDEIVKCLKTKSAEEIVNILPQMKEFNDDPTMVWQPVIEEDYGQERFLTADVLELLKNGQFLDIPISAGKNTYEFTNKAYSLLQNSTLVEEINKNFSNYAPLTLMYDDENEKSKGVSKILYKHYFKDQKIGEETIENLVKLYTDAIVAYPNYRAINYIAAKNKQPVFFYSYDIVGQFRQFIPRHNKHFSPGTQDDLFFMWTMPNAPIFNSSAYPIENRGVKLLTSLAGIFARTGDMNGENAKELLSGVYWPPFTLTGKEYLETHTTHSLIKHFDDTIFSPWKELFP